MACNCKRKIDLEKKYGVRQTETILGKVRRFMLKILIFIFLMAMILVATPIMIVVVIYRIAFKGDTAIVLPKFLGKYIKE